MAKTTMHTFLVKSWVKLAPDPEKRQAWVIPALEVLAREQDETGSEDMRQIFEDNREEFRQVALNSGGSEGEVDELCELMDQSFIEK